MSAGWVSQSSAKKDIMATSTLFGEKNDYIITMLQRTVSLARDSIIGIVALLTVVIQFKGGDASQLNALAWTRLIGAAMAIVLLPPIVYLLIKAGFWGVAVVSEFPLGSKRSQRRVRRQSIGFTTTVLGWPPRDRLHKATKRVRRRRLLKRTSPKYYWWMYTAPNFLGLTVMPLMYAILSVSYAWAVFWREVKFFTPG